MVNGLEQHCMWRMHPTWLCLRWLDRGPPGGSVGAPRNPYILQW